MKPLSDDAKDRGLDFRILPAKEEFRAPRIACHGGTDDIEAKIALAKEKTSARRTTRRTSLAAGTLHH